MFREQLEKCAALCHGRVGQHGICRQVYICRVCCAAALSQVQEHACMVQHELQIRKGPAVGVAHMAKGVGAVIAVGHVRHPCCDCLHGAGLEETAEGRKVLRILVGWTAESK
eukprot:14284984-Alexandrium_andersonii.AAC.1